MLPLPPDSSPHLTIGPLSIWIHERPYASSPEPYDADWLTGTVRVEDVGAVVQATGTFLSASGFERLRAGCVDMHRQLSGTAWLASDEPNVEVKLSSSDRVGHIAVVATVTADHLRQEHRFEYEIDQTYLPSIVRQCQ